LEKLSEGMLPTVYRISKLKSGKGPTMGCRAIGDDDDDDDNNNNNNNNR
jgi:hypothetical protein